MRGYDSRDLHESVGRLYDFRGGVIAPAWHYVFRIQLFTKWRADCFYQSDTSTGS
jgi:hypothetical protein